MNKPRLIDANALFDKLPYPTDYAESEFYGKVLDVINELPTAYDIDKVVEQLENEVQPFAFSIPPRGGNTLRYGFVQGINKAIEIVKGVQIDN